MTARDPATGMLTSSPLRVNPIATPSDVTHPPLRSLRQPSQRLTGVSGVTRSRARCAKSPPARRSATCLQAPTPTTAAAIASVQT